MHKFILLFTLVLCCHVALAQDNSQRSVNVEKSDNMDPDCENKKVGNILFINNSPFRLVIDIAMRGNSNQSWRVTVNKGEETPLMGIPEGPYGFGCGAFTENGTRVETGGSGSYYSGSVQVFKCKETKVKIK